MSRKKLTIDAFTSVFDYASIGDEVIAAEAQAAAVRIRGHQKAALVDIGRELILMKARLGHGHFIPWVEDELGISRRTASSMMTVAQRFGDGPKWESVSHLPVRVLYDLAADSTPDAVREAALAVEPGRRVDPAAVKRTISEVKRSETKASMRAAKKEAERLEQEQDPGLLRRKARRQRELDAHAARQLAEAERTDEVARIIVAALGGDLDRVADLVKAGIASWRLATAIETACAANARGRREDGQGEDALNLQ